MQISILQGSITGTPVYVETQIPTTNSNGVISIEIGNGTLISGSFSAIDWGNDTYFIKTETDVNGGSAYTITGTSQLLSVPYALYAKNTSLRKTVYSGVIDTSLAGDIITYVSADDYYLHYKEIALPEINTSSLPFLNVYLKPTQAYYSSSFNSTSNNIWFPNNYVPSAGFPSSIPDFYIDNGKIYILYKRVSGGYTTCYITGEYQIIILN